MEINNQTTKNAKKLYKEKGIIKTNVIRREIVMSWERTRMQERAIDKNRLTHNQVTMTPLKKSILEKMQYILDKLNMYSAFFVDGDGYIVLSNVVHDEFYAPQSFIEGICGNTAFSITRISHKPFTVYFSEHYMDRFDEYISYCIYLEGICGDEEERDLFLLVFDKKEIPTKEIEYIIDEACKFMELKEKAWEGNDNGLKDDKENIYIQQEKKTEAESLRLSNEISFQEELKYYLIGISQEIMDTKINLVNITENHRFARIFSKNRNSALACCEFIYDTWQESYNRAGKNTDSDKKSDRIKLNILNINSNMDVFFDDLDENFSYFIIIDSIHCISYKKQLKISKFIELLFNKKISFKIVAIFYDNLSEELINPTVINSLHSLAAAPRIDYADIDIRRDDSHLVAREVIRNIIEENPESRYSSKFISGIGNYKWVNGVSQLINYLEFMIEKLPKDGILENLSLPAEKKSSNKKPAKNGAEKKLNMNEVEKSAIEEALEICGGNVTKASLMLGISRSTMYRKIEKYGI